MKRVTPIAGSWRRIAWYLTIATFNAGFFVGLSAVLVKLGFQTAVASVVALVPVLIVSYFGHKRKTFASDGRHRDELPRFLALSAMDLVLAACVPVVARHWHIHHIWVFLTVSTLIPAANFLVMRLWIFTARLDADK